MDYPRINFIIDRRLEAEYLCFIAKSITEQHFQTAKIPVLSTPYPGAVYFPDLKYSPLFWRNISTCHNRNYGYPFPQSSVNEILLKLPTDIYHIPSNWSKLEPAFFNIFDNFLNYKHILEKIVAINVLVSPYGSDGSFYSLKSGHQIRINATYRTDLPLHSLVKTLLLAIFKVQVQLHGETGTSRWLDRQAIVEYLLTNSSFAALVPSYSLTQPSISQTNQSNKYLSTLGFDNHQKINIDDKIFTIQEKDILNLFIKNQSHITTFDDVATTLWGLSENSKYSLSAMAKVISHLRYKLNEQGINKNVIVTVRGQGYYLDA
jgi:hypothetical protein